MVTRTRGRIAPVPCIAGIVTGVEENRDKASRAMASYYEGTSRWLDDAIQSCKRKILEGSTNMENKAKKTRTESIEKENSNPNTNSVLKPVSKEKNPTGAVLRTMLEKEVPVVKSAGLGLSKQDIMKLKVDGLRKELQSRGVDTSGLKKKELQSLLIETINKDVEKKVIKIEKEFVAIPVESFHKDDMSIEVPAEAGCTDESMKPTPNESPAPVTDKDQKGIGVDDVEMDGIKKENSEQSRSEEPTKDIEKVSREAEGNMGLATEKAHPSKDFSDDARNKAQEVDKLDDIPVSKAAPKSTDSENNPHETLPKGGVKAAVAKLDSSSIKNAVAMTAANKQSNSGRSATIVETEESESRVIKKPTTAVEVRAEGVQGGPQKEIKTVSSTRPLSGDKSKSSSKGEQSSCPVRLLNTPAVALNVKTGKSTGGSSATSSSTSAVSKCAEAKLNGNKDARAKRIAEMRGKSKPIIMEKTKEFQKQFPSVSKLVSKTSKPVDGDDEKRKRLAAQMREKALRKQNVSKPKSMSNKILKQQALDKPIADLQQKPGQSPENIAPVATLPVDEKPKFGASGQKMSKKITGENRVLSPMDTYEMSEREDSDSEDESDYESDSRPKKRVPAWAQRPALMKALEKQYLGENRLDPDTIFHEVQTCDLEAIFGDQKKQRYKKRTSSGNWSRDQVSAKEKLSYKRTMGFA